LEYDLDQFHSLLASTIRLDAERRLRYIVDTMTAVGGLFSKDFKVQDRLPELWEQAGLDDG